MLKILLTLILLFAVSPSYAASDYLDSLRKVRVALRTNLRFDTLSTGGLSDITADRFIREAIVSTMPLMRGNKGEFSFVTTFKTYTYALDSLIIGISSVRWSSNDTVKILRYVPIENWEDVWDALHPSEETGSTGGKLNKSDKRPSFYYYTDSLIYLYPSPSYPTGDTIKIVAWERLPDIETETDFTSIETEFRVAILKYAMWRAALSLQLPLIELYYNDYIKYISDINISINRREQQVVPSSPRNN